MKSNNFVDTESKKLEELLKDLDPTKEEYSKIVQRLNDIEELKTKRINNKWFKHINIEQLSIGMLSLVEIFLIMKFEKLDSITTKAFSFVKKPR